ncbi:MAG: hypothetical protein GF349_02375 [Candidatus Magasanikbacteria bacterium]|nr:hypothetical protein [Candidatus Magasanikbacteria bacterium]
MFKPKGNWGLENGKFISKDWRMLRYSSGIDFDSPYPPHWNRLDGPYTSLEECKKEALQNKNEDALCATRCGQPWFIDNFDIYYCKEAVAILCKTNQCKIVEDLIIGGKQY